MTKTARTDIKPPKTGATAVFSSFCGLMGRVGSTAGDTTFICGMVVVSFPMLSVNEPIWPDRSLSCDSSTLSWFW